MNHFQNNFKRVLNDTKFVSIYKTDNKDITVNIIYTEFFFIYIHFHPVYLTPSSSLAEYSNIYNVRKKRQYKIIKSIEK